MTRVSTPVVARMNAIDLQRTFHGDYLPESPPYTMVHRPRLLNLIQQPYQASVTIVIAGAGYGKTTLAIDWAAHAAGTVRWLRLRREDNDPVHFGWRLAQATEPVARDNVAPWPERRSVRTRDVALAAVPSIATADGPLTLVMDTVDILTSPAAIGLLNETIAAAPTGVHYILLARQPLPLRLGRLRSQGQVREIDAAQLAFTLDEARSAMCHQLAISPDESRVEQLWRRVEGWAAGLHLGGMAMQRADASGGTDAEERAFRQFLDEFVQQEIIAWLPEDERRFLLRVASFQVVPPGLARAIDGYSAEDVLCRVAAGFPFAVTVAEPEGAIRLHGSVRESLERIASRDLPAVDLDQVRMRAACWYQESGRTDIAAGIAVAAGDGAWVDTPVLARVAHLADRSRLEELLDLVGAIPPAVLARHPEIGKRALVARLAIGRTQGLLAEDLEAVMRQVFAGANDDDAGRPELCRGMLQYWQGNEQNAIVHLDAAFSLLDERERLVDRMYAASFRGILAFRSGQDEVSRQWFARAQVMATHLPIDEQWAWRVIAVGRANSHALRGDLTAAVAQLHHVLAELPATQSNLICQVRCRLVSLEIERGALLTAREHLDAIDALLFDGPNPWRHWAGIARVQYATASGDLDTAQQLAGIAAKSTRRQQENDQLVLHLARVWLMRRAFPLVESWLADVEQTHVPWVRVFGDVNHRELEIDLALARGDFAHAAQLAESMTNEAAEMLRWAEYVRFASRHAVSLHELGRRRAATRVFDLALDRGISGGFVRSLSVPGADVVSLFPDAFDSTPERRMMRRSLLAMAGTPVQGDGSTLTTREVEVLALVAAGCSNQDIAARMFISRNTVRNHLVHLCRRLGVHSRSAAVARARELGFIE